MKWCEFCNNTKQIYHLETDTKTNCKVCIRPWDHPYYNRLAESMVFKYSKQEEMNQLLDIASNRVEMDSLEEFKHKSSLIIEDVTKPGHYTQI